MTPAIHCFRHEAMATWFEVRIAHDEPVYAHQAAGTVFRLIDRIEALLSRFREDSEISRINRLSPGESLFVSEDTFNCLSLSLELHALSNGAFDPALGLYTREERPPIDGSVTTRGSLSLYPADLGVHCERAPVSLDLGAIGKGYALDLAAEELREWDLSRSLLISGNSSILALSGPAAGQKWEISLTKNSGVLIEHLAIGTSGASVKGEHILNPRDGRSLHRHFRTWAAAPRAAVADALSTACMLMEQEQIGNLYGLNKSIGGACIAAKHHSERLECFGDFPRLVQNA